MNAANQRHNTLQLPHTSQTLLTTDYYSFGSSVKERTYNAQRYRYGLQSQENDNELYNENNAYYFKYREYDARAGRFFSIDPLTPKYPWNSPYAFSENRVVDGRDLEGREWSLSIDGNNLNYTIHLKVVNAAQVNTISKENFDKIITRVEKILSQSYENYNVKVSITYDYYVAGKDDIPVSGFRMFLMDELPPEIKIITKIVNGERVPMEERKIRKGRSAIGSTQENNIPINISKNDDDERIARTIAHELGHTAGLHHAWEKDKPGNEDIKTEKQQKQNLMNSGDNDKEELKSIEGRELVPSQMRQIQKTVQEQQPR